MCNMIIGSDADPSREDFRFVIGRIGRHPNQSAVMPCAPSSPPRASAAMLALGINRFDMTIIRAAPFPVLDVVGIVADAEVEGAGGLAR